MKKHLRKILLVVMFLVLIISGVIIFEKYQSSEKVVLEKDKNVTKDIILAKTASLITPEDFSTNDKQKQQKVFENVWKKLQSPEFVRIKIWDPSSTVIWSNSNEIIGQQFLDNVEVKEAFQNEVVVEFSDENPGSEYVSERQYHGLTETYVPITDSSGGVVGIVEIYKYGDQVKQNIWSYFVGESVPTAMAAVVILGILAVAFRFSQKNIV